MSTVRDLFSGTELYHVLEEVGHGTFGKVAKCWRSGDGELVAIKTVRLDPHRQRVIHNELRLVGALSRANLSDSHIVRFIEAFRDHSHQHLVFELLDKSVYQLQKEAGFRPMAVRHIRAITCQMLKALRKLREITVIHADLKPENIMLVDHSRFPFRVKLIDFGSSSILSDVRFVKEPYIQSRFYRSPEILLGLPFCEKVDMWSLGCVMAELYLGWPLYPGHSEMEQVRYICETQGLPHCSLLNSASKAHLFFTMTKGSRGESQWQLKPSRRCSASGEEGPGGEKRRGGGEERRKYILSSLDQLVSLELTGHDVELGNEDTAAEVMDRCGMVELLKTILTLDAQQRISPLAALCHPFITTGHLSSPEFSRYHWASKLAMEQAGVWDKVPVGDTCSPRQHLPHHHQPAAGSTDNTKTTEHKERHQSALVSSQPQESGELAVKCLSESLTEDALVELVKVLSTTDEATSQETSMGALTQEKGHFTSQTSSIKAGTSDCNAKLFSVGVDTCTSPSSTAGSLDCPSQPSTTTTPLDSSPQTAVPTLTPPECRLDQVKTALDHHHHPGGFQQPHHHPGEASFQFPQAECSFLGQLCGQNPQRRNPVHFSSLSRKSQNKWLSCQLTARCSRSDPNHCGLHRITGGTGGQPKSKTQPCAQLQTGTQPEAQPKTESQPQHRSQAQAQPQHQSQILPQHRSDSQSHPQHQPQSQPEPHNQSQSEARPGSKDQAAPADGLPSDLEISVVE